MDSISRAAIFAAVCTFASAAGAQDLASSYVHGSTSLTGGVWFLFNASRDLVQASGGMGASVRRVASSWAFEGRVGASLGCGWSADGLLERTWTSEEVRLGGAFGRAFVLGNRVALTPMLFAAGSYFHHRASSVQRDMNLVGFSAGVDLPLAVFLSPRIYYEPSVSMRVSWPLGMEPGFNVWFGQSFGVIL